MTGFQQVDDPLYSWARLLLPDYRGASPRATGCCHAAWIAVLAGLAVVGWRQGADRPASRRTPLDDRVHHPRRPTSELTTRMTPTREAGPMSRRTPRSTTDAPPGRSAWP